MKQINQFITEYIIKKKLDIPIDSENPIYSENQHKYFPKTKDELIKVIHILLDKGETNLNCIDTSNITDMSDLFYDSKFENINIDVSKWDVSNVKNMSHMFFECKNFEGNGIDNWDVSNVNNMDFMFYSCSSFKNNNLKKWNTNELKHTFNMFHNCTSLKNKPRLIRKK